MTAEHAQDLPEAASFRDPSGHVFRREGILLRRVEARYAPHYDRLMASGLYEKLVGRGLLLPHTENPLGPLDGGAYRVLRPERLPFISYPYEWCPGQLRVQSSPSLLELAEKAELGYP